MTKSIRPIPLKKLKKAVIYAAFPLDSAAFVEYNSIEHN